MYSPRNPDACEKAGYHRVTKVTGFEVIWVNAEDEDFAFGWYWRTSSPGRMWARDYGLHKSDTAHGPFNTSQDAYDNAQGAYRDV